MKPTIFIGSSTESLNIAYAAQESLDRDAEVTVWTQGIFYPNRSILNNIIASVSRFDFALFIFAPDDVIHLRDSETPSVGDNVLFELGLFMGRIGSERVFFIIPEGVDLHIPTDLLGISPLTFSLNRSDKNLCAALGPSCNKIRYHLLNHNNIPRGPYGAEPSAPGPRPYIRPRTSLLTQIEDDISVLLKQQTSSEPVLILADLDGFTGIIKWFGEEVSDSIIAQVKRIIENESSNYYWKYLGGDQFLICITDSTIEQAKAFASNLVELVALHPWWTLVPNLYVHISVGVATKKQHESASGWIIRAFNGANNAKKSGGNRIHMAPVVLPRYYSQSLEETMS